MIVRILYASASNLHPLLGGQNHVNHLHVGDLVEDPPWLIPQTCPLAHLPDGLPENIGQEADQDVGLHPPGLLVPNGSYA